MRTSVIGLMSGICLLAFTSTMSAHHAFSAEFDWKKPVTVTGTVTKFEWTNPHSVVYLDGKDESGQQASWKVELGSPQALLKHGWSKALLKQGDQITVDAWLAKDGTKTASAKTVKLGTGKELFAASSFYETTAQPSRQARR